MLYSDLKGRKLVDTSTADTVGKVDGFLLDPSSRTVAALEFKKTDSGSTVRVVRPHRRRRRRRHRRRHAA